MKTLVFSCCFLCLGLTSPAQEGDEYVQALWSVINIPDSQTNSSSAIASYINNRCQDDLQKVRSIYSWVITNIIYDKNKPARIILNEDRDKLVTATLKIRRGVCEHFASLFADICSKSGLKSYVIGGYTRQNGSLDRAAHAWCAVLINNKWSLFDPTWDAGSLTTKYFGVSPSVFIQTHMPFDPMQQMLDYPISYDDFDNGRFTAGSDEKYYNYKDSLIKYEKLDPLNQYLITQSRIQNNGTGNTMINTKKSQLKMEIEIINQDRDSANYNEAVGDYNAAVSLFNNFLTYRNNQFKPAKSNMEVREMFKEIRDLIKPAYGLLDSVKHSKALLLLDTGDLEYALEGLLKKVSAQESYFTDYQNTAKEK